MPALREVNHSGAIVPIVFILGDFWCRSIAGAGKSPGGQLDGPGGACSVMTSCRSACSLSGALCPIDGTGCLDYALKWGVFLNTKSDRIAPRKHLPRMYGPSWIDSGVKIAPTQLPLIQPPRPGTGGNPTSAGL
jgi:hypothetical protein